MASAVYHSCDCCVPPSPRESFVTQTNSQATLVALCRLSKQPPGEFFGKKKKYGTLEEMKDKWSMKYGVRENAECIFTLLLYAYMYA